jgi:hypothetical protein
VYSQAPGELRDIAGPVAMPPDPRWPAYAIAAGICIALGAVAYLAWKLWPRKQPEPAPPRPAHELALEQLHALEAEQAPERFWDALAATLRDYIHARFAIEVADATTPELLALVEESHRPVLRDVFTAADMARFAARLPDRHDALAGARRFVLDTAAHEVLLRS